MSHRTRLWAVVVASACSVVVQPVRACGGSGPGGTGACEFPRNRRVIRLGGSFGTTWSRISFGDGRKVDTRRTLAYATLATSLGTRTMLELGLGGLVPNGVLGESALGPGAALSVTVAWNAVRAERARPFVTFTGTLSGVAASTRSPSDQQVPYGALDARLGINVGYTLWRVLRPYAVGRVFGGPIFWKLADQRVTGTDIYKYQLGAGAAWKLPAGFDGFVEGVALGERGLFVGVGRGF